MITVNNTPQSSQSSPRPSKYLLLCSETRAGLIFDTFSFHWWIWMSTQNETFDAKETQWKIKELPKTVVCVLFNNTSLFSVWTTYKRLILHKTLHFPECSNWVFKMEKSYLTSMKQRLLLNYHMTFKLINGYEVSIILLNSTPETENDEGTGIVNTCDAKENLLFCCVLTIDKIHPLQIHPLKPRSSCV